MSKQRTPARVTRDKVLCRVFRDLGWFGTAFWGLMIIMGLIDVFRGYKAKEVNGEPLQLALETADYVAPFVCAAFCALHVWMVIRSRQLRRMAEDFRLFSAHFALQPDKSIPRLAAAVNRPQDEVTRQLEALCKRGYMSGFIDHHQQRMQFYGADPASPQWNVACCPGCGAKTAVANQGGVCRYCGTPLKHETN